jgi:hypothetical protein
MGGAGDTLLIRRAPSLRCKISVDTPITTQMNAAWAELNNRTAMYIHLIRQGPYGQQTVLHGHSRIGRAEQLLRYFLSQHADDVFCQLLLKRRRVPKSLKGMSGRVRSTVILSTSQRPCRHNDVTLKGTETRQEGTVVQLVDDR